MGGEQPPMGETRVKTRTKTGCWTCRTRRIKCDESKPSCDRCTSTGRKCDGYAADDGASSSKLRKRNGSSQGRRRTAAAATATAVTDVVLLLPRNPSNPVASLPSSVTRGLDYFRTCTLFALEGTSFEPGFWTHLVMPAAHSESHVRDCVVALGAIHEAYECCKGNPGAWPRRRVGVLDRYGRALRSTREHLAAAAALPPRDRDGSAAVSALVACVLLVSIDMLQRNYQTGASHMVHGFRILSQLVGSRRSSSSSPSPNRSAAVDHLVQMFRRIVSQTLVLERRYEPDGLLLADVGPAIAPFANLTAARSSLEDISTLVFYQCGSPARSLAAWHARLDEFLAKCDGILKPAERSAAKLLRIHSRLLELIVASCVSCGDDRGGAEKPPRVSFGQVMDEVESLVTEQLDETGETGGRATALPEFSVNVGVNAVLYYTALRSRDLVVRKRAVGLLRRWRFREGLWTSRLALSMAEMVVQVDTREREPGSDGGGKDEGRREERSPGPELFAGPEDRVTVWFRTVADLTHGRDQFKLRISKGAMRCEEVLDVKSDLEAP